VYIYSSLSAGDDVFFVLLCCVVVFSFKPLPVLGGLGLGYPLRGKRMGMGNQGNIGIGKGIWEGYLLAMVWEPNQMETSIFFSSRDLVRGGWEVTGTVTMCHDSTNTPTTEYLHELVNIGNAPSSLWNHRHHGNNNPNFAITITTTTSIMLKSKVWHRVYVVYRSDSSSSSSSQLSLK
jgi:hypothetical protein